MPNPFTSVRLAAVLCAGVLIPAGAAVAQTDVPGSHDHPLFTRMPDFVIYEYDQKDFDQAKLPVPDKARPTESLTWKSFEGKITIIKYRNREGAKAPSVYQITRNYLNAARKVGGTIEFDGRGRDWAYDGGLSSSSDLTMKFAKDGGEIWASLSFDSSYSAPDVAYVLTIVETADMAQDVMASDDMLKALDTLGKVTVYIAFDTGKATLRSESAKVIGEIDALLKNTPALRLAVNGHTDNVGTAAANQALSEARAGAVVAELVRRGVAAARLQARGFGQTAPVADNSTEEGRAKNRRVELTRLK